jgi:hypothetical protein
MKMFEELVTDVLAMTISRVPNNVNLKNRGQHHHTSGSPQLPVAAF